MFHRSEQNMNTDTQQLALDFKLEDGIFTKVPLEDRYIGAQVLENLTQGQYNDPLHCVREYVQNGVDAAADNIVIKVTGNSVFIHDDGKGMYLPELLDARGLGLSDKDEDQVGFRGIGIYSGYSLCDRMFITTKRKGSRKAYILKADFAAMRKHRDQEKKAKIKLKTSLREFLSIYTELSQEPAEETEHYSLVQLENISKLHIDKLSDRAEVKRYILRNVAVDFDDSFEHRDVINQQLEDTVGYHAVKITLESDSEPQPETVCRPAIPNLRSPRFDDLRHNGKRIGFCWSCLHLGASIPPATPSAGETALDQKYKAGKIPAEYGDHSGFVYKVKNFTIGNREMLQGRFKKHGNGGLYWWYTGEIFVLDPDVRPNTARDSFEPGDAQRQFDDEVSKLLTRLEVEAQEYREKRRAEEIVTASAQRLAQVQQDVSVWLDSKAESKNADIDTPFGEASETSPSASSSLDKAHNLDTYRIYQSLGEVVHDLKEQRSKATDKNAIKDMIALAEDLQRTVSTNREDSTGQAVTERKPKPTRRADKPVPSPQLPLTPSEPEKTLMQVFDSMGWEVSSEIATVLQVVDASLKGVLGNASPLYRELLKDIEAKLIWQNSGRIA